MKSGPAQVDSKKKLRKPLKVFGVSFIAPIRYRKERCQGEKEAERANESKTRQECAAGDGKRKSPHP